MKKVLPAVALFVFIGLSSCSSHQKCPAYGAQNDDSTTTSKEIIQKSNIVVEENKS